MVVPRINMYLPKEYPGPLMELYSGQMIIQSNVPGNILMLIQKRNVSGIEPFHDRDSVIVVLASAFDNVSSSIRQCPV